MGLKSLFLGLFSSTNKSKAAEPPVTTVEEKTETASPYAKYLQPEHSLPHKPQGHETEKANVFVATNSGAAGRGDHRPKPQAKASLGAKLKPKDVFLLDADTIRSGSRGGEAEIIQASLGVDSAEETQPSGTIKIEPTRPVDTVGLFYPEQGALLIRDPAKGKAGRLIRWEENVVHQPLFGDWRGDGNKTLGFFDAKNAFFYLWYSEEQREPDLRFLFGPPGFGWLPLVGDWDGDGKDGIGLYDPASSTFVLRNELSGGEPDVHFMYGPPGLGWIPLAGDWDGDGKSGVGVYNPLSGLFLLRNELSGGNHDVSFQVPDAAPDWIPLVGDWNGDGADSVGLYNPVDRTFYLSDQSAGDHGEKKDLVFRFGPVDVPGIPVVLGWNDSQGASSA